MTADKYDRDEWTDLDWAWDDQFIANLAAAATNPRTAS
mgnify:CR=1 FL=1